MRFLRFILASAAVALMLGGCGPAGQANGDGGHPGSELSGTLVGQGFNLVQTLDLSDDAGWQERIGYPRTFEAAAANPTLNELYLADALTGPPTVQVFDLTTFDLKTEWAWPLTDLNIDEVQGFAVSPDGTYAAAVVNAFGAERG